MNAVAQVLRDAKALIDTPEKWRQWDFGTPSVACCAAGALAFAQDINPYNGPYSHTPAYRAFCSAAEIPPLGVSNWNDAPERTHAEVMAAFDRAIALAETDG